jgi:hypothetical protein
MVIFYFAVMIGVAIGGMIDVAWWCASVLFAVHALSHAQNAAILVLSPIVMIVIAAAFSIWAASTN